jgi:hypothetical protein
MSKNNKSDAMFALLTSPVILDVVEQLIGGEIISGLLTHGVPGVPQDPLAARP